VTGPSVMERILGAQQVLPVVVVTEPKHAVRLAEILYDNGLPVLEVALRTPRSAEAIAAVRRALPHVIVGAGTVTTPKRVSVAFDAGAQFLVSPGSTDRLLDAFSDSGLPSMPGVVTPSEMQAVLERGYTVAKFFPAVASGSADYLRAVAEAIPELRFCPTGGVTRGNATEFLRLQNVVCVGGSWLSPPALVAAGQWSELADLARGTVRAMAALP
jgi:2-dehydro-3-deoxyphosphogluconate aldolase / (4S)-4-hydroxy-2-oxoglutarate aldolase